MPLLIEAESNKVAVFTEIIDASTLPISVKSLVEFN